MARITAADRRQQLIDAAFRVMTRDGVAAASTRAIAAEASAPLASFHYVFSSKEELLREVTESLVEKMLGAAMDGLELTGDVSSSLRHGLHNLWEVTEGTAAEQQMLFELAQHSLRTPGLEDLARWQYERYFGATAQYLEAIADAAGVQWAPSVKVARRVLMSFLDGLLFGWLVDRNSKEAREAIDAFVESFATLAVPRTIVAPGSASADQARRAA